MTEPAPSYEGLVFLVGALIGFIGGFALKTMLVWESPKRYTVTGATETTLTVQEGHGLKVGDRLEVKE